jgi:integrase/recombinase XerD
MKHRSRRTPAHKKAHELARHLRHEPVDYAYLKEVFRHLRSELGIAVPRETQQQMPQIPTEEELRRYYEVVWQTRNIQDMLIIKTLLYTGVRVSELVRIRLDAVDLDRCQIRIVQGKGGTDRVVPFPAGFRETLAVHMDTMHTRNARYLFESVRKDRYSERGIRKILAKYADAAGLSHALSPHQLRHFLLTWLKKQGIDDALIQPYSGHSHRQSLEIYSRLSLADAQAAYDEGMEGFPI